MKQIANCFVLLPEDWHNCPPTKPPITRMTHKVINHAPWGRPDVRGCRAGLANFLATLLEQITLSHCKSTVEKEARLPPYMSGEKSAVKSFILCDLGAKICWVGAQCFLKLTHVFLLQVFTVYFFITFYRPQTYSHDC